MRLAASWRSFFFSSRRRHTRYIGDWSSDVCSSDLAAPAVRFSSCFPWQRGVLFAPPPQGLWPPPETPGTPAKLRWKGAHLVPLTVVASLLRGETLDEKDWSVDAHSGCLLPAGGRFPTGPFRGRRGPRHPGHGSALDRRLSAIRARRRIVVRGRVRHRHRLRHLGSQA